MATALDYSNGRPSAASVLANGHAGVVRYVGTPGRAKNITAAEYRDMTARGVGVALVYENGKGDSASGYSGGQAAARAARADANSVGFPSSRPIYFAVDSDQVTPGQFAAAMSYLDGTASVIGAGQVGVYGEYDVIEKAVGPHARLGWQTVAWSRGLKSKKAALYQRLGQIYVGGIQCDVNDILAADWGQHNFEGDDMLSDAQIADWNNKIGSTWSAVFIGGGENPLKRGLVYEIADMQGKLNALAAGQTALAAAVAASTNDPAITLDAVKAIINDAIAQHVQITGTVEITGVAPDAS